METIVDNTLITLNSKFATKENGTYLSNVIFPFSNILKPNEDIKRAFISLQNATIPVSFYIINETNNRLVLKDMGGGGTHNIDIDYGNYSISTLIIELQTKINAGFPHTCTITFNKNTGRLYFVFSGHTQIRDTTTMDDILGTGGGDLNANNDILMPYPASLLGAKKLLVKSQALDISSFDSQTGNKLNILATIPVSDAFYGLIVYVPSTETKYLLTTDLLNSIDIQISDEENNLINFNNVNWTLTFCLTIEKYVKVKLSQDLTQFTRAFTRVKKDKKIEISETENISEPIQEPVQEPLQEEQPQIEDAITGISEDLPIEEEQLPIEKLQHTIYEPETLSDSLKQYSEAMLKGTNNYTKQFRDLIKQYGDNVITKMELKRSPVRKMIVKTLDILSLGGWEKVSPYDKLFHLYILLTLDDGTILRLEKNSVLSLKVFSKDDENTESLAVKYPTDKLITLNTLLENTRKYMGKKYFLYNAKGNNCQDFMIAIFISNGLGTKEEIDFIKQDTRDIFNKNPDYLRRIALFTTNLRAGAESSKSYLEDLYKHKADLYFLTR
jgi:hypothetical protein